MMPGDKLHTKNTEIYIFSQISPNNVLYNVLKVNIQHTHKIFRKITKLNDIIPLKIYNTASQICLQDELIISEIIYIYL
jgi:hypothetical protein